VSATGYVNGCPVVFDGGVWKWADTRSPISEEKDSHVCPHCGKSAGPNGEDGCLGHLPGVKTACCGHGRREGYIIFENGIQVRFQLTEIPTLATPSELGERTWIVTESGEEV